MAKLLSCAWLLRLRKVRELSQLSNWDRLWRPCLSLLCSCSLGKGTRGWVQQELLSCSSATWGRCLLCLLSAAAFPGGLPWWKCRRALGLWEGKWYFGNYQAPGFNSLASGVPKHGMLQHAELSPASQVSCNWAEPSGVCKTAHFLPSIHRIPAVQVRNHQGTTQQEKKVRASAWTLKSKTLGVAHLPPHLS